MIPVDIPRLEAPGSDAQPRVVRFQDIGTGMHRRGFLAIVGSAAMTLGLTVLGWIPLARPARAEQGNEYPDCGRYADGVGGPICYGSPYSPSYCGPDQWFKDGCYGDWNKGLDCYSPASICRAGEESLQGWRWMADGVTYRCADGTIQYSGAPNLEDVICSATLDERPVKSSR